MLTRTRGLFLIGCWGGCFRDWLGGEGVRDSWNIRIAELTILRFGVVLRGFVKHCGYLGDCHSSRVYTFKCSRSHFEEHFVVGSPSKEDKEDKEVSIPPPL